MKKALLIALLLITGCSVFAKSSKHKKKLKTTSEIVSVSMRRTGCYGRCAIYTIEVNKNGMATYTAVRFTADSGVFKKNIGSQNVTKIFNEVKTDRIDTCKDAYENRITDLPGMIITIVYTNTTKTINNANYGPAILTQLATAMDAIVNKKVDDTWGKETAPAKR